MDISRRKEVLGFEPQKEKLYSCFLPYSTVIDKESVEYLTAIKQNFSRGLLLADEQCLFWIDELDRYMEAYGFRFSKEDHILFVKMLFEFIFTPNLSLETVVRLSDILTTLLSSRSLLSRDDLQLDWQKPFKFSQDILYSKNTRIGYQKIPATLKVSFEALLSELRTYYPVEATQEMLDEWMPKVCPFLTLDMQQVTWYFRYFLPTSLREKEHSRGWKLWFIELMELWQSYQNVNSWESNLLSLFARLARDARGYVDWTPWLPLIFSRFHQNALIGADTRHLCSIIVCALTSSNAAIWSYLVKFFRSIEPSCYPDESCEVETDLVAIILNLCLDLSERLYLERYARPTWMPVPPEDYRLTDKDCEQFAKIFIPILTKSVFGSMTQSSSISSFHYLALFAPKLVIPPVLTTLLSSFETVTEPYRLVPSMKSMTAICRTAIENLKGDEKGPKMISTILNFCLNAVDVNDFAKSETALELIRVIVINIPLVDLTKCKTAASEQNEFKEFFELSKTFETFVLNFVRRIFATVESLSPEPWSRGEGTEAEVELNPQELDLLTYFKQTFNLILIQSSDEIFEKAQNLLYDFVKTASFDYLICGRLLTNMIRSCAKVSADAALEKFFPTFSKLILKITEEEPSDPKSPNHQLLFCLSVICKLTACPGKYLIKYKDELKKLLHRCLSLKNSLEYSYSAEILRQALFSLTNTYTSDFKSHSETNENQSPKTWGQTVQLENIKVSWYVPQAEEFKMAESLLDTFLNAELNALNKWVGSEISLTKEECRRTLTIISSCLFGASSALPPVSSQNVLPIGLAYAKFTEVGSAEINFCDGSNVREALIRCLRKTLEHVLTIRENDSESVQLLVECLANSLVCFGCSSYGTQWVSKCVTPLKAYLKNHLRRNKDQLRLLHLEKIMAAHDYRLTYKISRDFTSFHKLVCSDLLVLCVNHYEETRNAARGALQILTTVWPEVSTLSVAQLVGILAEPQLSDERLCGIMRLLVSIHSITGSLDDWKSISSFWKAFINSKFSGNERVLLSLDNMLSVPNHFDFQRLTFEFQLLPATMDLAKKSWSTGITLNPDLLPSELDIKTALNNSKLQAEQNFAYYNDLVNHIIALIYSGKLHWRYEELGFSLLLHLIRSDVRFPTSGTVILAESLIHTSLFIRKLCITGFGYILQQEKRKHLKTVICPFEKERKIKDWLHYKLKKNYMNKYLWKATVFVEKSYWGFYAWPKNGLVVYDKAEKQPKLDRSKEEMNETEVIVYDFFNDKSFLGTLMAFLTIEEVKGVDVFDQERFALFKRLFRNYGPALFFHLKDQVQQLAERENESCQRCACEIIAGLIRGSKHWTLKQLECLREYLLPIMQSILRKMTIETRLDWAIFFIICFNQRDARRLCWLVDLFIEDHSSNPMENVFYDVTTLLCLHCIISQQSWRGVYVLQYILDKLLEKNRLSHDFTDIRERVGSLLESIFCYDCKVKCKANTIEKSPKRTDLVQTLIPKLDSLRRDSSLKVEFSKTQASNLLKTVCSWIKATIVANPCSLSKDFYLFLPILCETQNDSKDETLCRVTEQTVMDMAVASLDQDTIVAALDICKDILKSKSWKSRKAVANFVCSFTAANMFFIAPQTKRVTALMESMLDDEQIDVRQIGANILSVCVQYALVEVTKERVEQYKKKAAVKIGKHNLREMVNKHNGVISLCAIVDAHPYDVPAYLPDILTFLTEHLQDGEPISTTIRETLRSFRESHYDNWREFKLKFSEQQLDTLNDLLISPNYYA